jgi:hypothetical protein
MVGFLVQGESGRGGFAMILSGQSPTAALRPALLGVLFLVAGLATRPTPAIGQDEGLRGRFVELFTFGSGCETGVLFCLKSGSGTPDFAQQAFSTNADATARELTHYLQGAIARGLATVPAPSAGSGETFRLSALGVPVRNEETSLGPILAERALTLGRGQFLIGANVTDLRFENLRGVSLDSLEFNVVQRDLPPSGPPLGDPTIERTYVSLSTHMAVEARVANFFLTAGVSDRLDVGVLVPVVQLILSGYSDAEIVIGEGEDPAAGFSFGGPTEDPQLHERAVLDQQKATGLGDVSVRGKLRLTDTDSWLAMALLTDFRIPTGRDEDFLGSEGWSAQGLGVISTAPFAGFSPHLNLGGVLRSGEGERSAVVGTFGFDHRSSARLTIAGELLAQIPLGENPLVRSEVIIQDSQGSMITVPSSNLPTLEDYQFDGALGFKLRLGNLAIIGNAILPMNDGGLRSEVLWTVGLQGGF